MIHYHGTPFSGGSGAKLALQGRHAMVSFEEPKDAPLVAELCQSFTLDNGAFSAWTRKAPYDPVAFMSWAREWLRHPGCDFAIAPDVIDGTERENDELLLMCEAPAFVPVWHLHESLGRLERLVTCWPRVALGSSGAYAVVGSPEWWSRMAEAMAVATDADGMPLCKLHGLRMLDPVIFSHVPLSSADSTNVARNVGVDQKWSGRYQPRTPKVRALVMMDRIETHAAAHRWSGESAGVRQNLELMG